MGRSQLRNRWEMRNGRDLRAFIGDAFTDFTTRIRYTALTHDRNRWPTHMLWDVVTDVIATDLATMQSGVIPDDLKGANRAEHMRMLDAQLLGILVSRAAAGGIKAEDFDAFLRSDLLTMKDASKAHPLPIVERLAKSAARYRFR